MENSEHPLVLRVEGDREGVEVVFLTQTRFIQIVNDQQLEYDVCCLASLWPEYMAYPPESEAAMGSAWITTRDMDGTAQ